MVLCCVVLKSRLEERRVEMERKHWRLLDLSVAPVILSGVEPAESGFDKAKYLLPRYDRSLRTTKDRLSGLLSKILLGDDDDKTSLLSPPVETLYRCNRRQRNVSSLG